MNTIQQKAQKLRDIIILAKKNLKHGKVHTFFGKRYKSIIESKEREEIISTFMEEYYYKDSSLRDGILWINHWINISSWEEIYKNKKRANLFLFEEVVA